MKPVSNAARGYSQFAGRPDEFKRNKNLFDLSHDVKTTFSMGQLIPFLTLETLPGDKFEINFECMTRFAPLYLPIMHRCDLTINYFYVTNRILWNNNGGQVGGTSAPNTGNWMDYITQNVDLVHPHIVVPTDAINTGKSYMLLDYMGFPTDNIAPGVGDVNFIPVNAFPFAAYWKIYDEYYRNPQVEAQMWYPLNAGENDLSDWPNYYVDDHGLFVAYKLWNRDYFTSCLPSPQVGAEVLVPITNPNYESPEGNNYLGPYRLRRLDTGAVTASGFIGQADPGAGFDLGLMGADQSVPSYLDIQETSAPMRDFRLAARMLEFLERLMRISSRYRDFLKGEFGVDPDPGTIDLPVYIGGQKGRVIISEVMSTAETTEEVLGNYAGQALAVEGNAKPIKYFCKEHGIIMGIINIQPRSSYMQGLSRMWTRGTVTGYNEGSVYDYAFEQFAGIGDQAVKFMELRFDYTDLVPNYEHNLATFGYIPRYSEYRWQNDIISAQMRTIWQSFHMGRIFTQDGTLSLTEPVLNREFVSCRPRIDDIFQIGAAQDHEIYCHIFNSVKVWRSLPKFGVPSL